MSDWLAEGEALRAEQQAEPSDPLAHAMLLIWIKRHATALLAAARLAAYADEAEQRSHESSLSIDADNKRTLEVMQRWSELLAEYRAACEKGEGDA